MTAQIGIIGGSGLYSMPGFEAQEEASIETPFGRKKLVAASEPVPISGKVELAKGLEPPTL